MKVINLCTFLLCSILLVGCSSTRPPLTDDASTVTESYILGAGDTVNIMVYGEPEMTMKFIIDKSGAITFPYIGKLMLKGKTALITGGSGGIGFAIAKAFLQQGCEVVIAGTSEEKLAGCCEKLSGGARQNI